MKFCLVSGRLAKITGGLSQREAERGRALRTIQSTSPIRNLLVACIDKYPLISLEKISVCHVETNKGRNGPCQR